MATTLISFVGVNHRMVLDTRTDKTHIIHNDTGVTVLSFTPDCYVVEESTGRLIAHFGMRSGQWCVTRCDYGLRVAAVDDVFTKRLQPTFILEMNFFVAYAQHMGFLA